jgi:hypothetical protein
MLGSLSIMPKQSACAHLVGSPKPARNHIDLLTNVYSIGKRRDAECVSLARKFTCCEAVYQRIYRPKHGALSNTLVERS